MISGLGVIQYIEDWFNVFDGTIVIIGLFEYSFGDENSSVSVLRSFRVLRVFKLIKKAKGLQKLIFLVFQSLEDAANLGILILLYVCITALVGK